jgi:hypothetical protein
MAPRLQFELIIEIIHRLDYTCFPKILHVNREIRAWVLDNWSRILKRRPVNWRENIPAKHLKRINRRLYIEVIEEWRLIKCPSVVKVVLLQGAQVDYEPNKDYNCFKKCIRNGNVQVAKLRNRVLSHCSSC